MKKETKTEEQILTNGAERFMGCYQSAAEAVLRLTDSMHDIHVYERKFKKKGLPGPCHCMLLNIIEEAVIPWIEEGEDVVWNVGTGIKNLFETYGYCGFQETMIKYLLANTEMDEHQNEAERQKTVNALMRISEAFRDLPVLKKHFDQKNA